MPRNRRPSSQSLIVLRAFAAQPGIWRYGYDITRETALRPGTLYPLLMRLAEQGILEAEWQASPHPGRPARHAYRLTSLGASLARETQDIGDAADPLGRGLAPT